MLNLEAGTLSIDSDLYLTDVVLSNVVEASINNAGTAKDLHCTNVTWIAEESDAVIGAARIVGATASADQVAAQISLRNHASGGGSSVLLLGVAEPLLLRTVSKWSFSQIARSVTQMTA